MGELKPDVDLQALNEWFADIPPGPYDALNTMGGWEVRQIDTDPTDKHNWPFRLCSSISGQTAECDAAVFNFIAGVINAWPQILDAARTEGRGEGEPVASDKALFDALWELVAAMANEGIPQTPRTKAAFKVAHQAALDRLRKDWSSPIREPEISRTSLIAALDVKLAEVGGAFLSNDQAADAILNLAPVGGRGEVSASDRAFVRHLIREMRSAIADDPNDATITTGPLDPDILERVLNVALGAQDQGGMK